MKLIRHEWPKFIVVVFIETWTEDEEEFFQDEQSQP